MGIAIKVENLSKAYQLGDTSATLSTRIDIGTIIRDLERYRAKIRGKKDPFLRIGETNDRSKKDESDIVWSLKFSDFKFKNFKRYFFVKEPLNGNIKNYEKYV